MKRRNQALKMSLTLCLLLAPVAGWGQTNGWHYNAGGRLLGVKSRGNNIWVVGAQGLILHSTDSGNTWNIRESGTSVDLYSVSFPDSLHGWIVGDYGSPIYLLHTTDGGLIWQTQTINNYFGRGVSFVDTLHGWICGTADSVLKTTDGGTTWTKHSMNQYNHGTGIIFLDTLRGWMSTDFGSVEKTTDSGQTWIAKPSIDGYLGGVDMLDSLRGWTAGGRIFKTTDGGESWSLQYTPYRAGLKGISIGDSLSIWTCGGWNLTQATIIQTSNGGSTWIEDSSKTRNDGFYDVFGHLQKTNVTVVGDGGAIVRSTNAGSTWRVIRNADIGTETFLNVTFWDVNRGWASGTTGVISHTTNGGTVWQRQTSNVNSDLWGISFGDPLHGWICTYGGGVLGTKNGGNTWVGESTGTTYPLYSIDFADTLYGIAVGGTYILLDTIGGPGETALQSVNWMTGLPYPKNEMLKQVQHDEIQGPRNDTLPLRGINPTLDPETSSGQAPSTKALGEGRYDFWKWPWKDPQSTLTPYRAIIRTTNGGALWIAVNSTGQVPLYGVSYINRAEGWACGDPQAGMGVILHTTDSGATWQGQTSNVNQSFHWIQFLNPLQGWTVGSGGTALWTTDGGNSWNQGTSGTTAPLWSCAFYDAMNGFACGGNGLLIKTTDGGRNWQPDTSKVHANLYAVNALDSTHAWTVGDYGMVLGWKLAGPPGVETRGQGDKGTRRQGIALEQSYPNPMRENCAIGYWLLADSKAELSIYDITGRRVRFFAPLRMTVSGKQMVRWDGKDEAGRTVPAGVYFYQLKVQDKAETRKLVKVQ
jgi:photosystem II stability/assembly factor-like uncharacterized protein